MIEAIKDKVPSATVKQHFGQILDEVQHQPITITRRNRDIAMLISMRELNEIAKNLLSTYFWEKVEAGEMTAIEAIKMHTQIRKDHDIACQQIANGHYKEANADFFANIKKQALDKQ